jgi:catechol 2,3-dioxygenase-like lactoylglutathione lyase family enzyme
VRWANLTCGEIEMSSTEMHSDARVETTRSQTIDFKLEVVTIPVSDPEQAKRFYMDLGWRLDADFPLGDGSRAIQLTPPGSPCSVHFSKAEDAHRERGLFLVVSDLEGACAELTRRGVKVSAAFHRAGPGKPAVDGVDPEHHSYASYASFSDPDGNSWLLQEVTTRLPGRVDGKATAFSSSTDLAGALRRAALAHGEHEKTSGARDEDWPDWYARYLASEQAGTPLPN